MNLKGDRSMSRLLSAVFTGIGMFAISFIINGFLVAFAVGFVVGLAGGTEDTARKLTSVIVPVLLILSALAGTTAGIYGYNTYEE
jgi:ABC-type nitrate/sulfonate/bicarbonate transport system permease component